jgi:hypothetical protein
MPATGFVTGSGPEAHHQRGVTVGKVFGRSQVADGPGSRTLRCGSVGCCMWAHIYE